MFSIDYEKILHKDYTNNDDFLHDILGENLDILLEKLYEIITKD